MRKTALWLIAAAAAVLGAGGCIVRHASVKPVPVGATHPVVVTSPVKVHLRDGTTVNYRTGFTLDDGMIRGIGQRYDLTLREMAPVSTIRLDSVVGAESYRSDVSVPETVLLSTGVTVAALIGSAYAAMAIFGSCPTFYSDSAGRSRLEAEGFSYSIAPLFEGRDVDRLRATAQPDGSVRIEVRNEAFETHHINQLELLAVDHAADEFVLPDPQGRPVAVHDLLPAVRAIDRAGHDVTGLLAAADGRVTRSDSALLANVNAADLDDHIDLTLPVPRGADRVALVLRMRNSLLNTVLLYDFMLGAGGRSLDWLGGSMRHLVPAFRLGRWYSHEMGLRVQVRDGDSFHEVAHVRDTGPIAWKDVAIMLPSSHADSLHVRLSYVADNWRIDRVAIGAARAARARAWPLAEVIGADERPDTAARQALVRVDGRYLETSPGQHFTAVWRPDGGPPRSRTYLLVSQGYYTEWMREAWLAHPREAAPFRPSNNLLADAVKRWSVEQHSLEAAFYASRLPVR